MVLARDALPGSSVGEDGEEGDEDRLVLETTEFSCSLTST